MEGFLGYELRDLYFEGLIHGGAYFQNVTVCQRGLHLRGREKIIGKKYGADKLPNCCKQTS